MRFWMLNVYFKLKKTYNPIISKNYRYEFLKRIYS